MIWFVESRNIIIKLIYGNFIAQLLFQYCNICRHWRSERGGRGQKVISESTVDFEYKILTRYFLWIKTSGWVFFFNLLAAPPPSQSRIDHDLPGKTLQDAESQYITLDKANFLLISTSFIVCGEKGGVQNVILKLSWPQWLIFLRCEVPENKYQIRIILLNFGPH